MLATIHLLVGAAIGKYVDLWPLAFGMAFLSHFFLDFMPHVDAGTLKRKEERGMVTTLTDLVFAWADLLLATVLLLFLTRIRDFTPSMLFGVFGGISPDFAHGAFYLLPVLKTTPPFAWYYRFHRRIQRTVDKKDWLKGLAVELIVVLVAVFLYLL